LTFDICEATVFFVFPDLAATHVVRIGVDGRGYASIRLGQRTAITDVVGIADKEGVFQGFFSGFEVVWFVL